MEGRTTQWLWINGFFFFFFIIIKIALLFQILFSDLVSTTTDSQRPKCNQAPWVKRDALEANRAGDVPNLPYQREKQKGVRCPQRGICG